jgi:hypothetical protein
LFCQCPACVANSLCCSLFLAPGDDFFAYANGYHAEAGIAAEHCFAPSFRATRWKEIVDLYAMLEQVAPSPLHTMNRAIAVAEWRGAAAALALLDGMVPPTWLEVGSKGPFIAWGNRPKVYWRRRVGRIQGHAHCEMKALGSEVAADGEEAIFGAIDRRKPQPAIELVQRQHLQHNAACGIWAGVCDVEKHLR